MRIPSGVTDQYIYFVAVDATDLKTRETGLSSFTVYRSRNGAAAAAMTTPTVNETDSSNMPGVYELLLDEDMTIGSGNDTEAMVFHITATGMAPVTREIELYRPKITAGNTLGVAADGDVSGNIDGNVADVVNLSNLPTIPSNWITAAGIAASALDGKGDWNTTTPPTAAAIADQVWDETQSGHTTAGTFGELATEIQNIETATAGLGGAAMRGTDGAYTGTPPTAAAIVNEWETQSQADPTGFHVNVKEWTDTAVAVANGYPEVDTRMISGSEITANRMQTYWDSAVQGAADSGSTTTMVDAALTQTDNTWIGALLTFTTGTNQYRSVVVTDFDAASDTITFAPALDTGVTTESYILTPGWARSGINAIDDIDAPATWKTSINTEVDTALADIHLDHLLAVDYDPASKPGTATALLNELIENDGGVSRFTANALEQAPSGGGGGGLTALASGTAQAGASNTIQLATGESAIDDTHNGCIVNVTAGTGAGQSRLIRDYTGSSKQCTVSPNWATNPDATSEYEIVQGVASVIGWGSSHSVVFHNGQPTVNAERIDGSTAAADALVALFGTNSTSGTADSGTVSTLVDSVLTEGDDVWIGALLLITSGTNVGCAAEVTDFVASTDTITFTPDMPSAIDATSAYRLIPGLGFTATNAGGGASASAIADAVWDEDIVAAHGTADTAGEIVSQLTKRSVTWSSEVVSGSVFDQIADDGTATYDRTTDSLQALADSGGGGPTAAQIADAVWDEAQADHVSAGSFGLIASEIETIDGIVDTINTATAGLAGAAMRGTDGAYTGTPPTAGAIADAVWDEAQSAHTTAGSFGVIASEIETIDGIVDTINTNTAGLAGAAMRGTDGAYTGTPPTAGAIADQVWDEAQADHTSAGSFGEMATETANLDAAVSSRAVAGDEMNLANNAVAAGKIASGALTATKFGSNAIDAAALANDAVLEIADGILTRQMTESYAANGVAPTVAQAFFAIHQMLMQFGIVGTSITVRQLNDVSTAFVVTLDDAANPTDASRT